MKKMSSFFNNPRVLMAISLLASIIIFFFISILYSPETERSITDVPIEIPLSSSSKTNYLTAFSGIDLKVKVTVKGKKYVVEQLDNESFSVVANVESINGVGEYTLDLSASKASGGDYSISSIFPQQVTVMVDVEKEMEFSNVEINCVGATIDKVADKTQSLLLEPSFSNKDNSTIKVKGPDKEIKKIKNIKAVADVNTKLTESRKYTARIEMYDENGNVIYNSSSESNELKYSKPSITSAEIIAGVNLRKTVPIKYNIENGPPSPPTFKLYEVNGTNISTKPTTTVSIKGEPSVVKNVNSITLDNSINFSEFSLESDKAIEFVLTLPVVEGITYDEYAKMNDVHFVAKPDVTDYTQKTLDVSADKIVLKNVPAGVNASVKAALKGITIVGKKDEISEITSGSITVTVDCSNVSAGTVITPVITVSSYKTCWVYGTYQVSVDVSS